MWNSVACSNACASLNAAAETTRKEVRFGAPSGGVLSLSNAPITWSAVAATEIWSYGSLWDHLTAGNCLEGSVPLAIPKAVTAGGTATLTALTWTVF